MAATRVHRTPLSTEFVVKRRTMRRAVFFAAFAMLAFCTEQNRIFVHTGKIDDVARPDVGEDIDIVHVPTDGYSAQRAGFYAVHDLNDWLQVWKDPRHDADPPPPPQSIDFKKEMLFVATAPTDGARKIEIKKIVVENSGVHIYLVETLGGSNCPSSPPGPPPMDIVVFKSSPFDIHVHHDRVRADECGPPPDAVASCRVAGSGSPGQSKITVSVGQTIDCDASASKPRTGSLVDRGWQLTSAPPGSTSKFTLGSQGLGMTMLIDAWGTYVFNLEVRDEARTGMTTATIEAPPPDVGVPLALQWAGTERTDDVSMVPRVELHIAENGNPSSDCGPAAAKPWCEVHVVGTVQDAVLRPEAQKTYRAYVSYQDFRLRGAPTACVRAYPKGAASRIVCDENVRNAGAVWELGTIDDATSTFYDLRKGKPAPVVTAPAAPIADAGAPVAPVATSAVRDAGTPVTPATARDAGVTVEHKLPF